MSATYVIHENSAKWGESKDILIVTMTETIVRECKILRNDPDPQFQAMFQDTESGLYGDIAEYTPEPPPVPPAVDHGGTIVEGVTATQEILPPAPPASTPQPVYIQESDESIVYVNDVRATKIELWRVRATLRTLPAGESFVEYVTNEAIEIRNEAGDVVPANQLTALDQINSSVRMSGDPMLQEFWNAGNFVYDISPNFTSMTQLVGLTDEQVKGLIAYALNLKV
jgi:hypothetical protein